MQRAAVLLLVLAACSRSDSQNPKKDGGPGSDDGGIVLEPDASPTLPTTFRFAVVGDTRPANEDDVAGYPTAIITKIWQDVQASTPHPDFAVSTGDYIFANSTTPIAQSTVDPQLDHYLAARAAYTNAEFPAMGNHECTGATASNCGAGSTSGITNNLAEFQHRMLGPLGITDPYYAYQFASADHSWTAKVVVVAANAWNLTQSNWLDQTLAIPTTYTFVVRHEGAGVSNGPPGLTGSETIIAKHPLTLKIVGHTHTYYHDTTHHELVNGNGGAPLTSGQNFGYAIVERLASGDIQVSEHDYQSNAVTDEWRVHADGSSAP